MLLEEENKYQNIDRDNKGTASNSENIYTGGTLSNLYQYRKARHETVMKMYGGWIPESVVMLISKI